MFYEYYYWGMSLLWWPIWLVLLIWIFVLPYDIPGQRRRKNSPLDILDRRLANKEISPELYEKMKVVLQSDLPIQDRL